MIRNWPYFAAVFIIINTLEAFNIFDRTVYGEWEGKPGDLITQGINLFMIACSVALFIKGLSWLPSIKTGAILMVAMSLFLLSSMLWSGNPSATFRQGVIYLTVVIGSIGIAGNFDADEYMDLLAKTCGVAAIASLLLIAVAPGLVFTSFGDFRGIFSQKNVLGEAMSVGALANLHGLRASSQHKWRNLLFLVSVAIACFLSKSATSLATIFVFCGVDVVIAMVRKGGFVRLIGMLGAFVATVLLVIVSIFPDWLLAAMGKDPTLTGRTEIWGYVLDDIYQKPLLGWGYSSFWSMENPAALAIDDAVHWMVPQAHNGLLEILLSLGLVGAMFWIFLLVRNIRLGLQCLRDADRVLAISSLLCCAGIILVGISEMVLLNGVEASTPLFFIAGLYTEKALWSRRLRFAAPVYVANTADAPITVAAAEIVGNGRQGLSHRTAPSRLAALRSGKAPRAAR